MSPVTYLIVSIIASLVLCTECYLTTTRMRNGLTSVRAKQTTLYSQFHEAAEKGDMEVVKGFLDKDPTYISRYDIDGKTCWRHDFFFHFKKLTQLFFSK